MDRIEALRAEMAEHNLAGCLIPSNDAFQNEYVPACYRRLEWLTGFSGSNGFAIILKDRSAFFTDGRYTLQASREVDKRFDQYNMADTTPVEWLEKHVMKGEVIAYDARLHTLSSVRRYGKVARRKGFTLAPKENFVDNLWKRRPLPPEKPVIIHDVKYAGQQAELKVKNICDKLKEEGADALIITNPDSLCWLLNIRGGDVPHTPIMLAYGILYKDGEANLFISKKKLSKEVEAYLGSKVNTYEFAGMQPVLSNFSGQKILIDPDSAPSWFFDELQAARAEIIEVEDPCQLPKACKNLIELEGMRAAHVRDGVAVTSFLYWLKQELPKRHVTEIDASDKLAEFRKAGDLFQGLSFDSISAFGPNGAIVHYHASEQTTWVMRETSLYLIDSGAQYLDGTTDVTRTIALGKPTDEQKNSFTRVLKGHIALAMTKFPEGTTGSQLDSIARYPLWQQGLDYDHGTGHGVGSYLSVHEGPQRISRAPSNVALKPGMVLSNEPGYYKPGEYGIRIESLVVVVELQRRDIGKPFYGFETLTMVPIDTSLIDASIMSRDELRWLNNYHARVREALSPFMKLEAREWLVKKTEPI